MLQVSKTNSRIVEGMTIQIGAIGIGLVEGATSDQPLNFAVFKEDFFKEFEMVSLADLQELATELTDYCYRVEENRKISQG